MSPSDLILRFPGPDDEEEFLRAHRATSPEVPYFLLRYEEGMAYDRYCTMLRDQQRGVDLPANHVPSTFHLAFLGDRIVGRTSIRHRLNPFLERIGGHIGYVVVPEFRRSGVATEILRQSIEIIERDHGVTRILVTCDIDNVGSRRTIEKNGGVLENIIDGPDIDTPKRRYWVERV